MADGNVSRNMRVLKFGKLVLDIGGKNLYDVSNSCY